MYESTSPFLASEIAYRTDRIRADFAGRRRRGSRVPRIRRPAESIDRTR